MKIDVAYAKKAALGVAMGAVGAALFLFAFPGGSISTLMHDVLHLPGPGAGIAAVFGPFLIFVLLLSSLLTRTRGVALIAALAFVVSCMVLVQVHGARTNPKGAFGSLLFLAALALLGLAIEVVLVLSSAFRPARQCLLTGAVANAVLLIFYWLVIFPRTASWVKWKDVPVLMGICLVTGLLAGYVAWLAFQPLSRVLALGDKE
ncbi:MAG TPA: hypothetical protein VM182_03470 [Terriglobia bacterium]|nr:hypothetical protein [Terriglobia bacterium]